MSQEQLDKGTSDGCVMGRSSGKIGFLGTTPIAKQTITLTTATATTGSNEATINAIVTALVNLGLVASTGP